MLYSRWLAVPLETRNKIAQLFGIGRRGGVEVNSNEIKSDGYLIQDVEQALNVEALQNYLRTTETNLEVLWNNLLAVVEGRATLPEAKPEVAPVPPLEVLPPAEAQKHKRQYKARIKNTTPKRKTNAKTKN